MISREERTMKALQVLEFDPSSVELSNYAEFQHLWLLPLRCNQGEYDAVGLNYNLQEGKMEVTFILLATGPHDLKLHYFHVLLKRFAEYFETKKVEILFVIPQGRTDMFYIRDVTGSLPEFGFDAKTADEKCLVFELNEPWIER